MMLTEEGDNIVRGSLSGRNLVVTHGTTGAGHYHVHVSHRHPANHENPRVRGQFVCGYYYGQTMSRRRMTRSRKEAVGSLSTLTSVQSTAEPIISALRAEAETFTCSRPLTLRPTRVTISPLARRRSAIWWFPTMFRAPCRRVLSLSSPSRARALLPLWSKSRMTTLRKPPSAPIWTLCASRLSSLGRSKTRFKRAHG